MVELRVACVHGYRYPHIYGSGVLVGEINCWVVSDDG